MGCCASVPAVEEDHQPDRSLPKKELKKDVMQNLTAEGKADALLAMIPGRMFANGASNNACIFTQQGRKGTNQDAMVVWENYASMEDTFFCGVFDGHGPFGHLVARRVRDSIPSKLLHYWQEELVHQVENKHGIVGESLVSGDSANAGGAAEDGSVDSSVVHENGEPVHRENGLGGKMLQADVLNEAKEPPMFEAWKESHLTAYRVMDKELRSHPGIDCFCSGTTAVTVLKQILSGDFCEYIDLNIMGTAHHPSRPEGKHLVIGNVGDSRAILGTKNEKGAYVAVQLTVDLKPNLPREAERIRQCRGRVFALHDEPEVPRVWLPFDDSPGLAMARAFGDFCLKDYGVIAVPEMSYRELTHKDQFIVLATDGIWDVLSNDEVVQVVAQAPTRATAARALVESAVRVWRLKYPTSKVDDCAVVCLYVDQTFALEKGKPKERSSMMAQSKPATIHDKYLGPTGSENSRVSGLQTTLPSRSAGQDPQTSYSSGAEEISSSKASKDLAEKKAIKQPRKLADWLGADAEEEEEWSALEGVTRVNSLLNLPRFQAGDKRAGEVSQERNPS